MARIRGIDEEHLAGLITRFEALVARLLRSAATAVARMFGRHPSVSVDDLAVLRDRWATHVDAELLPALAVVYDEAARGVAGGVSGAGGAVASLPAPDAATFLAAARNRLVGVGTDLWEAARAQLVEGVHAGEGIDQLAARVQAAAGLTEARARQTARTEVIAAHNAASLAQARLLGDPTMTKTWLATPDDRTRATHRAADGQRVRLRDHFEVGGFHLEYPGDPAGPVEEVAGCRCSLAYDFDDTVAGQPLAAAGSDPYVRDNEGKFAEHPGGGGVAAWVHDVLHLAAGTMTVGAADNDRVTLNLNNGSAHTWLSDRSADKFAQHLRYAGDHEVGLRIGRSENVADYPPNDPRAYALTFASIKRTGVHAYEIGLAHGDGKTPPANAGTFTVNAEEAKSLATEIDRLSSARKIGTSHGDFTAVLGKDNRITTTWPASGGKPITLNMSAQEAENVQAAIHDGVGSIDEFNPKLGPDDVASMTTVHLASTDLTVTAYGQYGTPSGRFQFESSAHDWVLALPDVEAERIGADGLDGPVNGAEYLLTASSGEATNVDGEKGAASMGNPTLVEPAEADALLVAAADVATGAMVALIPADDDGQRLAVDGGEPVDQLHCTLLYLGPAADIPDAARAAIIDAVRSYVDGWPPVQADGFAINLFNPGDASDRETCVVLGLSGDDLDIVHDMVGEAVGDVEADPAGFTLPEQHAPWVAHVTLAYSGSSAAAAGASSTASLAELLVELAASDRIGPVTFDKVRVVFGGDATDIPLDGTDPPEIEGGEALAAAAEFQSRMPAQLRRYWIRRIAPWGHGSFKRCVRQIRKHYPQDPEGTCANLHHEATGKWPGAKRNHADDGETTMASPTMPTNPAAPPTGDCSPGQHPNPDSGDCVPDEGMAAAPVEHFHTSVTEGVSTGLRKFAPDSITWRDTPFAYHEQVDSSAHNGQPRTVQVGLVTRVERDGDTVHFYGCLDLKSPQGLDYARRLAEGFARWSSVGGDESVKASNIEFVWPEGEDSEGGLEMLFADPEEIIFHAFRVAEVSAVSVPAMADATVEPTPALLDALTELGVLIAAAVGTHTTGTSSDSWDAAANEKRLPSPMPVATARKVYAWLDDATVDAGKIPKSGGKFPHHNVAADGTPGAANLAACSTGIGALHGGRGGTTIPDADRRGVYNHLAAHLRAGGQEPPEFAAGPIVAASYTVTIPDLPPAAWFDEPADMSPHGELRVNEAGRIWGYLAPSGVAHRSFGGRRVEVPMGRVDYSGWQNKPWPVAEGHKVYTGVITMECGHASTNPADWSYSHRREHYDNSCSVAAHARIGENRHGVWVAGALAPWLDAERLGKLMSCQLSGDWDSHKDKPGWREFVAALLVPVEGFPKRVPTATVRVAEGALVASAVPVRLVHGGGDTVDGAGPDLRPALERVARGIGRDAGARFQVLRDRIRGGH